MNECTTKKCSKCKSDKSLDEFNKNRNSKDGLQDKCRACFSEYNRARYRSRSDEFKQAIYQYRAANPEKVLESRLSTAGKNPTHINAYRVVEAAIACGRLVKPDTCHGCGCDKSFRRIEAHHHDYTKPLDVIWLCRSCHASIDKRRRMHERLLKETA